MKQLIYLFTALMIMSCTNEPISDEIITADAKANVEKGKGKPQTAITLNAVAVDPTVNPVFIENFDSTDNWTFIDADGDGKGFQNESMFGRWGMVSRSWEMSSIKSDLTPDNWMISKAIVLNSDTNRLKWDIRVPFWDATNEYYSVYVSTGNTIDDFLSSPIIYNESLLNKNQQYRLREINISQFAGQTVYIAFRHYNSKGVSEFHIDNLKVDANLGYLEPQTFPDGFDALNASKVITYIDDDPQFIGRVFNSIGETWTLANGGTDDNIGSVIVPKGGIYLVAYTSQGVTVEVEYAHFTIWTHVD